jgi:cell division protein FtsA
MAKEQIIAGIDIGNSKIRTVIGIIEDEKSLPNVIGVGISESTGLRKGAIIDIEETIHNITASLEEAERMAGETIDSVFVGISGSHIESLSSRGVIAVSNSSEIMHDDVERVLEAAQTIPIPVNRQILRIVPRSFTIDDQHDIRHPIGMSGIRLEVDAQVITGSIPAIKNIEKCIHQVGIDIDDLIPSPLASAESVLTKRQKELGVVNIDIGAGSTSIAVFEEGALIHSAVLPVGGSSVTNDIAIGLRTSVDIAEKLKIEYGSCDPHDASDRDEIDLSLLSKIDAHKVGKKHMLEIIEARYHEIFVMVKDELVSIDRDGKLPAGVILTGGAVKIPNIQDLARNILNLPIQIGFPTEIEGIVDKIDDPSYATLLGLIAIGVRSQTSGFSLKKININKAFKGIGGFIKRLFP